MMVNNKVKKKLKILMLNYEFPPLGGGAGNATYYILKEFSKTKNLKTPIHHNSVTKIVSLYSNSVTKIVSL